MKCSVCVAEKLLSSKLLVLKNIFKKMAQGPHRDAVGRVEENKAQKDNSIGRFNESSKLRRNCNPKVRSLFEVTYGFKLH